MSDVVVLGGGIIGLATAMLLARDGREVLVLERDAAEPPGSPVEAWESWERKGVAQFRQPHNFMPGMRHMLADEMPDMNDRLREAGGDIFHLADPLPPGMERRDDDDRFWTYTARRPAGEWVFASAAAEEPRVEVRRGVHVTELVTGPSVTDSIPHVTGVRTSEGEEMSADLVVDATGRRSKLPEWLSRLGARAPYEEDSDCGFAYYTRYFSGDAVPPRIGPVLSPIGTMSLLTIPGDNGTWSLTIFTSSGDAPLKRLRFNDVFTEAIRACPIHAHWLDGEPITDVLPMSGMVDRYRRFVVDGSPVATGVVAVADAWACTNPSLGRGMTVGLRHAIALRDAVRDNPSDPSAFALAFDDVTEARVTPWFQAQIASDRVRFAEIEALREGREVPAPTDENAKEAAGLFAALMVDPDLFRYALEYVACITPIQEVLDRPGVRDKIAAVRETLKGEPPRVIPGPSRTELLQIVG